MSGPQVCVGAIAVDQERLLLVRRARPPSAGRWSIPGGRVEDGEALADAVVRETAEETGVTVRCGPLAGWVERRGEGSQLLIMDFFVAVAGPTSPVAGDDADAAEWVPLAAVPSLDLVDGLEDFLRANGPLAPTTPRPGAGLEG